MPSEVIATVDGLTPDRLTAILRSRGYLDRGTVSSGQPLTRLPGGSWVVPLEVSYSADAPLDAPQRLIFKAPRGRMPGGARVKRLFTRRSWRRMPAARCR